MSSVDPAGRPSRPEATTDRSVDAPASPGPLGASGTSASLGDDRPVSREVDATGLSCPMPVIELARAVDSATVGDVIALTATDPAARVDVPVWCRMQRHALLATQESSGTYRFLVERRR